MNRILWMYIALFAIMLDGWIVYALPHPFGLLFFILQMPLIAGGVMNLLKETKP